MRYAFYNSECQAEQYLYHYTRYDIALKHILPSLEMRFNPMIRTNDPRESKVWQFSYYVENSNNDNKEKDFHYNIAGELQKRCKVVCFTEDNPARFTERGIKGLHRGYSHPRMWDQYAKGHTGLCFVLNKDMVRKNIEGELSHVGKLLSGRVDYNDNISSSRAFSIEKDKCVEMGADNYYKYHLETHYRALFFEKLPDWEAECEYRWVLLNSKKDDCHFSLQNAIEGIVLGINFPKKYLKNIQSYCIYWDITLSRLDWINGHPILYIIDNFD